MTERVLYARRRKSTSLFYPVTGGTPITGDIAINLRHILFGSSMHVGNNDWLKAYFDFQDINSSFGYGLNSHKNKTKGILMVVQAYILRHLLFHTRAGSSPNGRMVESEALSPTKEKQQDVLCQAIVDIIWRASLEKGVATVCLPNDTASVEKDHNYFPDGITEKLLLFDFARVDELRHFLTKYLYLFQQETGPGVLILIYSTMLSRGIERLTEDMTEEVGQLITPLGDVTRPLVNLILTGRGTPFLHNGTMYIGSIEKMAKPRIGITLRNEVGFLAWHRTDSDISKQIGSRLKTPMLPIWLTCADDSYGVLFNPNRDLVRDHRAEHRFDLHYYNGGANQTPTILSIDTRHHKINEDYGTPALEKLILTKWQGAKITWNNASPIT